MFYRNVYYSHIETFLVICGFVETQMVCVFIFSSCSCLLHVVRTKFILRVDFAFELSVYRKKYFITWYKLFTK